jgi:hypothetical protein
MENQFYNHRRVENPLEIKKDETPAFIGSVAGYCLAYEREIKISAATNNSTVVISMDPKDLFQWISFGLFGKPPYDIFVQGNDADARRVVEKLEKSLKEGKFENN